MQVTPITTTAANFTITVDRFEAYELAWGAQELAKYYTDPEEPCTLLARTADRLAETILEQLRTTHDGYTADLDAQVAQLEVVEEILHRTIVGYRTQGRPAGEYVQTLHYCPGCAGDLPQGTALEPFTPADLLGTWLECRRCGRQLDAPVDGVN